VSIVVCPGCGERVETGAEHALGCRYAGVDAEALTPVVRWGPT
jgi:hypothetical protein